MPLNVAPLGPFGKGIVENASPAEVSTGAVRFARGIALSGANKVIAAPGTEVAMSFVDDQVTPAAVSSIRAIQPFADTALVVAWSSVTSKVYLYRVATDFSGWYNAAGALQANTTAQPVGVIWPATGEAPVAANLDVTIAEGLGTAWFATPASLSATTLNYRLRSYTVAGGIVDVTDNLDGTGAKPVYALGCVSFQEHLWIWGYGSDSDRYRPELLRFSGINFDPSASTDGLFNRADSFTLGDRLRSKRERVVGAGLAGDNLIVAGTTLVARISGYGRDTWYRQTLEKSYGLAGPKAWVSKGGYFFYWSAQHGPMRVGDEGPVEPLFPRVDKTAKAVPNVSTIVGGYDDTTDRILFFFDSGDGSGVRKEMSYDVIRDAWLGPDADAGINVGSAGTVERVLDPSVVLPAPPAPSGVHTTTLGTTTATLAWTCGNSTANVEISWGRDGSGTWDQTIILGPGTTSYTITPLLAATSYRFRVRHVEYGQYSSYAPDATGLLFTTNSSGGGGTPLAPPTSPAASSPAPGVLVGSWVNGTPSASTEVWESGPNTNTAYALKGTRPPGYASYSTTHGVGSGTYYLKFRHTDGTNYSAFTSEVSQAI